MFAEMRPAAPPSRSPKSYGLSPSHEQKTTVNDTILPQYKLQLLQVSTTRTFAALTRTPFNSQNATHTPQHSNARPRMDPHDPLHPSTPSVCHLVTQRPRQRIVLQIVPPMVLAAALMPRSPCSEYVQLSTCASSGVLRRSPRMPHICLSCNMLRRAVSQILYAFVMFINLTSRQAARLDCCRALSRAPSLRPAASMLGCQYGSVGSA